MCRAHSAACGGAANHRVMMNSGWRYAFDLVVILLCVVAVLIALVLLRAPGRIARRWFPHAVAWVACAMLTLRGVAGMVVDGVSDPIWWPTFLIGGILFGMVAWLARLSRAV